MHTRNMVQRTQAKRQTRYEEKTLIIDEGTTECNNLQLNKLFSIIFLLSYSSFVSLRKQQKSFYFYLFLFDFN